MGRVHVDVSQLRDVGTDMARNAGAVGAKSAAALRKTAFDIERTAKPLARVDTGALRNSISTEITGDGRFSRMSAEIGPTVDYGLWQEIGTSVMAGQPYMAPAFDRHEAGFVAAIATIGGEIL